jgi:6-phosphogluconolactonase/glucosamine-6-phosphate isomerase/deaminase
VKIEVLADANTVATRAAEVIAAEARAAVAARGRFIVAVSGGHTPWPMLRALANEDVPWESVYVVQIDERNVLLFFPAGIFCVCLQFGGSASNRERADTDSCARRA